MTPQTKELLIALLEVQLKIEEKVLDEMQNEGTSMSRSDAKSTLYLMQRVKVKEIEKQLDKLKQ